MQLCKWYLFTKKKNNNCKLLFSFLFFYFAPVFDINSSWSKRNFLARKESKSENLLKVCKLIKLFVKERNFVMLRIFNVNIWFVLCLCVACAKKRVYSYESWSEVEKCSKEWKTEILVQKSEKKKLYVSWSDVE